MQTHVKCSKLHFAYSTPKRLPKPVSLANTLFNLAAVARAQSRLSEAEALYNRSIKVRETTGGPDLARTGPPPRRTGTGPHGQG